MSTISTPINLLKENKAKYNSQKFGWNRLQNSLVVSRPSKKSAEKNLGNRVNKFLYDDKEFYARAGVKGNFNPVEVFINHCLLLLFTIIAGILAYNVSTPFRVTVIENFMSSFADNKAQKSSV
ncbi:hypothetical protein [Myxosarcina sp. GI1]|uniref:hypothetical protein n=1 Tax=Myxosarcina sp. GI1 TaxID=1541065 RepID=UPI000562E239|nr:hypothetical protein [Myxosarcina sp. GI1]